MAKKSKSTKVSRTTYITERQAAVHALFMRHQSMSIVARIMGVSPITIRETLVQYERNQMRDHGITPPPLKAMLRGNVALRFGVDRQDLGGRPPKHEIVSAGGWASGTAPGQTHGNEDGILRAPSTGVLRVIITSADPGAQVHEGFWRNLRAFAAAIGAGIAVVPLVKSERVADSRLADLVQNEPVLFEDQADVATDLAIQMRNPRPLAGTLPRGDAVWTIVAHPRVQLETMPRLRAEGLRIQMTTGASTLPRAEREGGCRSLVGAVIVELSSDGIAHCRHITSALEGDGSFQDLTITVSDARVVRGCRVEAINFGDVHHSCIDGTVVAATWGGLAGTPSLVDRLRPAAQIYHDVCDFSARSPFDRSDHHLRFAQLANGGGSVRDEIANASDFLSATLRPWSASVVVSSNHDNRLVRWLRDTDYREDPSNALFYLESSLALHRRLAAGGGTDGFFEEIMRAHSPDGLRGVRFLRDGESCKVAGVEVGMHGDKGVDGKPGGLQALERLGVKATIGHTHRPTTRDDLVSAGVCQAEIGYSRGALTAWAIGHVVTYSDGGRQHLLFHGGRFHG